MKIFLVCSGGMSTGLLANAMKKEAALQQIQSDIEAISLSALPKRLPEAAVVLVAPQVRHRYSDIESSAKALGKPVGLIDGVAYGTMNGKIVLRQALDLT